MLYKIAISGKAKSGKNTVGQLLTENMGHHVKYIAFADPIKQMARLMFPNIPKKWLYGSSELRSKVIPGAFKNNDPLTVRQLLIDIGTDCGRIYKEDVWLNAFDHTFKKILKKNTHIIVTDVRFRNEFDHLKKLGFYQIRLLRDSHLEIDHVSETNQDTIKNDEFDYILRNNSTLEDLKKEVSRIVSIIST